MPHLLIAVGGSGEHVAMAVARLIQLRAFPPTSGIVVDADNTSDLANTLKSFDGYVKPDLGALHPVPGFASFAEPFDSRAAATAQAHLAGGKGGAAQQGGLRFDSLMMGQGTDEDSREVFKALYSQRDAAQDVLKGFFARPILGSTAFAAQGDNLMRQVVAEANRADQIAVTGSFIGGTGAGVLPSLVRQLSGQQLSHKLHGAFLLEWLQSTGGEGSVTTADMQDNARHGLEYFYKHMKDNMKYSALVGPPATANLAGLGAAKPTANGGETLAVFPVMAAHALLKFFMDASSTKSGIVHAYAFDYDQPDGLLAAKWHGSKSLRTRLYAASRTAHALRLYEPNSAEARAVKDSFGLLGSKKRVPVGLGRGIDAHARNARDKPDRMAERVFECLAHHRTGFETNVARFATVFQPFGGLGTDTRLQTMRDSAGATLSELQAAWNESDHVESLWDIEQDLEMGKHPEAHARSLATKLLTALQDHFTD